MSDHCVQVFLKLSDGEYGTSGEIDTIHELSEILGEAIEKQEAGEFDGDEIGEGEATLFMYGPDADKLFEAIKEPLLASPLSRDGYVVKRYGPAKAGVKEERIEL